ncbi:MAG: AMP-binding protein [Alphaproteobacteria bacterium]|jgi:acyl-CoA synthetase (AMP-forming)/AMP-acid ligase II|nr:AMP-binding protein [Alphaproteobacteria bacterium]
MQHPYSYYPGRAASWSPEKTALIEGEKRRTYAEFDARIGRTANALAAMGVEKGDRVAVLHQNNITFIEQVCGAARAGAVFVPLLGILPETDHAYMVADSGARVVLSSGPETDDRAQALQRLCPAVEHIVVETGERGREALLAGASAEAGIVEGHGGDLAQILYTSGTTGEPKGVMHSYASTQAAMSAWVHLIGMTADDVNLLSLPISHFGARVMDSAWCVGATGVLIPGPDPKLSMAAIQEHRVSNMLLIPTILAMLLDHPEVDDHDLSSLRFLLYAAAPAAASLVRRATEKFGPVLHTGWGQTEAYVINTHLTPAEHEAALRGAEGRLISCGREAATNVQLRLVDEDDNPVPPGAVGEACIQAPWQAVGYWNRPELTAERFAGGWLHTRDLLRRDEDGYYYVVDRKDDMIISGGYNVYPREVEEVLYTSEAVLECAVVSVPDDKWGEAVKAVVALRPGAAADAAELTALCKAGLAAFKVPKSIDFVEALPKTSVGKISRRETKARYWADQDRQIGGVA